MKLSVITLAAGLGVSQLLCAQNEALVDSAVQKTPLLNTSVLGDSHINVIMNTSFTADADDDGFEKLRGKMNYLKWEIKGRFFNDFSYHFRQSMTKKAIPGEVDKTVLSVDYAHIGWQVTPKFSVRAGKQMYCFGGYEYWVSGYKVQEFSAFNNYIDCYAVGLSASYLLNQNQTLKFQVLNSKAKGDDEAFRYGRPVNVNESKFPLLATVNWDNYCLDRELELRYSLSWGQQVAKRKLFYFTSGHIVRHRKLLAYLDINMSLEGVDSKGLVSSMPVFTEGSQPVTAQHAAYFNTIANVDYRLNKHWNVFAKAAYDMGGVTRANSCYQKGIYFHEWQTQLCAEFYPKENLDLKLYLHALYKQRLAAGSAIAMGSGDTSSQRLAVGVVYAIPVF